MWLYQGLRWRLNYRVSLVLYTTMAKPLAGCKCHMSRDNCFSNVHTVHWKIRYQTGHIGNRGVELKALLLKKKKKLSHNNGPLVEMWQQGTACFVCCCLLFLHFLKKGCIKEYSDIPNACIHTSLQAYTRSMQDHTHSWMLYPHKYLFFDPVSSGTYHYLVIPSCYPLIYSNSAKEELTD